MKRMIGWLCTVLLALCLFAVPAAAVDNGGEDAITVSVDVTFEYDLARAVFPLVNAFRTEKDVWYWNSDNTTKTVLNDLKPLEYDYELEEIAMRRAAEIAVYLAHQRPDGSDCFAIYPWGMVGENIACGQGSANGVMTSWREEDDPYSGQGHRRNMLGQYFTRIGVGCVRADGRLHWVQAFCDGTVSVSGPVVMTSPFSTEASLSLMLAGGMTGMAAEPDALELDEGSEVPAPVVTALTEAGYFGVPVTITDPRWETEGTIVTVDGNTVRGSAAGETTIRWTAGDTRLEVPVKVNAARPECAEHTWGEEEIVTQPTCSAPGLKRRVCTVCLKEETEEIPIDPDAHDWAEPEYEWTEDRSAVTAVRSCRHNAAHTETETVQTTVETTPATREAAGKTVYTAMFTNPVFTAQTLEIVHPKLGPHKDSKGRYDVQEDGTAVYTGPAKARATVTVPDTVTVSGVKVKVTAIADGAFLNDKKITKLTVGKNVTSIGANAFSGCVKLKKAAIGAKVARIGSGAFKGCVRLTSVTGMAGVTDIGKAAFKGCKALPKITIPAKVKSIGAEAFSGCAKLKAVTIKTTKLTMDTVGAKAFKGNPKNAVYKCPKKKVTLYRKILVKKGASKKAAFR